MSDVLMSRMRDVGDSQNDATTALMMTTARNGLLASAKSHLSQEKIDAKTSQPETGGTSLRMIMVMAKEQRRDGGCSTTTRTATLRRLHASRN